MGLDSSDRPVPCCSMFEQMTCISRINYESVLGSRWPMGRWADTAHVAA